MNPAEWVWMPHAGHFICGSDCRFHLNTRIGKHIISTVGEYLPDSKVREVLGGGEKWHTIGVDRLYETMVFRAVREKGNDGCCPWRAKNGEALDFAGYNEAGAAYVGHLAMCRKWAER